jgi:hypothetical protein
MALLGSEKWIEPEELRKSARLEKEQVDSGNFNGEGDYGSYYAYKIGVNKEFIKEHAIDDDQRARKYAEEIKEYVEANGLPFGGKIADMGCAIGTITNALNGLNSNHLTYGVDISDDAIEIAKNKYPDCRFICHAADDLSIFDDGSLDIVHAREFYPFTRTNDVGTQLMYLREFAKKAKNCIVLSMVKDKKGLYFTVRKMDRDLRAIGISALIISIKISGHLYQIHPFNLLSWLRLIFIYPISRLRHLIRGKRTRYIYYYLMKRKPCQKLA